MSNVTVQMKALLGEDTVGEQEEMDAEVEVNMKALAPQLILAMQAMGLDPGDEDHLDAFMKTLKVMATSKANILKVALRRWTGAKAKAAVKVAKATL
jgi:hypothetical protein